MWDLIVSVPDHCLSFYFTFRNGSLAGAIPLFVLGPLTKMNQVGQCLQPNGVLRLLERFQYTYIIL